MKRNRILNMVMAAGIIPQVQLTWFPPRVDEK